MSQNLWRGTGFDGGIADAATGLERFGFRDLDPRFGSWTSKDPLIFDEVDPNSRTFVHDDAVNEVDPNGLCNPTERCIEKYRLDTLVGQAAGSLFGDTAGDLASNGVLGATAGALAFVDLPKASLFPYRAIGQPESSLFSSALSRLGPTAGEGVLSQDTVRAGRALGRRINPLADALTIFEGFYDGTVVIECLSGVL